MLYNCWQMWEEHYPSVDNALKVANFKFEKIFMISHFTVTCEKVI